MSSKTSIWASIARATSTVAAAAVIAGCGPVVPPRAQPAAQNAVIHTTPTSLERTKGRVVLVDFWATYCVPCMRSFPKFQELVDQFGDDFTLVAISVDEPDVGEAALTAFATEARVRFPLFWDTEHDMQRRFVPKQMPTSYVLDRSGEVRFVHRGFEAGDEEKIADEIGQLIAGN